jgi:predicted SAM-dependent methyltransferase
MIAGLRCLEIGPGDCPLVAVDGSWDTLDAVEIPSVPLTYVARWGYEPLPIPDNSYDLIFTSHAIEHIPWYQTLDALKEVHRILAPDGDLEIWTLDFTVIVEAYRARRWVRDWDCGGKVKSYMHSIAAHVFAYEKQGNPMMWHKALFDHPYMESCLLNAGFRVVDRLAKSRGHDHGPANMGFRATK